MRVEMPHPAHFICAFDCRFRRATYVGPKNGNGYIISTVGEYFREDKKTTIGAAEDSFYETYIFKAKLREGPAAEAREWMCCPFEVESYEEIWGERRSTAVAAAELHELKVAEYERKRRPPRGSPGA